MLCIPKSGPITENTTWSDTSDAYCLVGDIYVDSGVTLTIASGVQVRTDSSADVIEVRGVLDASGVAFAGNYTQIFVKSGGRANLTGGTTIAGNRIVYESGSNGNISNSTFSTAQLQLFSSSVSVSGTTFWSTEPVEAYPSLVDGLYDNTFAAAATILVRGAVDQNVIWHVIPNVSRYRLSGDVSIDAGITLTIQSGVEVRTDSSADVIEVRGVLDASGVAFAGNYTQIFVKSGGRANLTGATTIAGNRIVYESGSLGTVRDSEFSLKLDVDSQSAVQISQNNLSNATVEVRGNASDAIDMRNNYWGTTNSSLIEAKIHHHVDDASLPTVLYNPWLTNWTPIDPVGPQASLTAGDVTASGGTSHSFNVTYTDNVAIDYSDLDGSDVRVTGPSGYNQLASFVSVDIPSDGTPRVATYRINAPGGTWDMADNGTYTVAMQAAQVSDTSDNFVASGNLGTFLVNISPPDTPTATLAASAVDSPGGTNHRFTVTYEDNVAIDVSDLDGSDIRVTGPNGYNQLATSVSVNIAMDGTPRIATYEIAAPGGTWDMADNGTYTVWMQANQVTDTSENSVPSGNLGTFLVSIPPPDTPTATLVVSDVTSPGGTAHSFAVTYTDNVAIDVLHLDGADIRVTGPNGYDELASFVSVNIAGDGTPRVATYRISAPGGMWDAADSGMYIVAMEPNQVSDTSGNFVPSGILGTFVTNIPDTQAPTATLAASDVTSPGGTDHSFTVTYTDNVAIDTLDLDWADIRVTGPNGYDRMASFVSVDIESNGTPRVATYRINAPEGTWDTDDNGTYTVVMQANQVSDTGNNYVASGNLGTFIANLPDTQSPAATLAAADVTHPGGTHHSFTVTYTDDVAVAVASLDGADVRVLGPNGYAELASFVSVNIASDGTPRVATYRISAPGGTWDEADSGTYTVAVQANQVNDPSGNFVPAADLGTFQADIGQYDFGDAPAPYLTTLAFNGARHLATGPRLGDTRGGEPDGQPSAEADGDGADEDGVVFGLLRVGQLAASMTVNVQNAPTGAKLDAWVDLDADGSWCGPSEHVARAVSLVSGNNTIWFDVPSWAKAGTTFARVRLSTEGNLSPSGATDDGEVEDYRVTLLPPVASSGVFGPQTLISSGVGLSRVVAADMNQDWRLDVVRFSPAENRIVWLRNNGAGQFSTIQVGDQMTFDTAQVADVDGDGYPDVLSAKSSGPLHWWENSGQGSFVEHTIADIVDSGVLVVADLDSDGDSDVLTRSAYSEFAWYENDGHQGFLKRVIVPSTRVISACVSDLDRDGDLDVIWTDGTRITWQENDGEERFTEHEIWNSSQPFLDRILAADLDNDGDVDVISTDLSSPRELAWYENLGSLGFAKHVIATAFQGFDLAIGDMNGDGALDLVCARYYEMYAYLNDGHASFIERRIYQYDSNLFSSPVPADFDANGDLDVLFVSKKDMDAEDAYKVAWIGNIGFDFGDAGSPYPSRLVDDGARHALTGPRLGALRDGEPDANASQDADGDGADEDGVRFLGNVCASPSEDTVANVEVDLQNPDSQANRLDAWIDFNRDGDWDDPGERIFSSLDLGTTSGLRTLDFVVPAGTEVGRTLTRFRLSSVGGLAPTGEAPDGEVEDYLVALVPMISVGEASVTEGDIGPQTLSFIVTLSAPSPDTVTVDYMPVDDTATASDGDYVAVPKSTLVFASGETRHEINVTVVGDRQVELDEAFFLRLSNPVNAGLGNSQGRGIVMNDDSAEFMIDSVSGEEDAGTLMFTVTLSNPVDVATRVDVTTADGSATVADGDYAAVSGLTLEFPAGVTSQTVEVHPVADHRVELTESFTVGLGNAAGGGRNVTAANVPGTATIRNDDSAEFTIDSVSGEEDAGALVFTVKLSNPVDVATSVDVATADGSATVADGDYVAVSGLTLEFPAGVTSRTVEVHPVADSKVELTENFTIGLGNAAGGGRNVTAANVPGTATIRNDDSAEFTIDSVAGEEDAGALVFTVTLSNPVDVAASVDVTTADGSATVADGDYVAVSGLMLEFLAGVTSRIVEVQVVADNKVEQTESFTVGLGNASAAGRNVTASLQPGTGTIVNDDDTWTNPKASFDANADSLFTAADALVIINEINGRRYSASDGELPPSRPSGVFYFDVSGDGYVMPVDVLLVINFLNRLVAAEGEGYAGVLWPSPTTGMASVSSWMSAANAHDWLHPMFVGHGFQAEKHIATRVHNFPAVIKKLEASPCVLSREPAMQITLADLQDDLETILDQIAPDISNCPCPADSTTERPGPD